MTEWAVSEELETLRVLRQEDAALIELNRPEALNALNATMAEELLATLRSIGADTAVRAVLLTGAGRGFCAGADIGGPREGDRAAATRHVLDDLVNPIVLELRRLPKPVVAAVNGPAAGVGCSFALASDIVLAAESSYFLLAFAKIGLAPDGGASMTLAARVGLGRASTLAMLAERLPAAQAVDWGLADRLVADDELVAEAKALALQLAAGPTRSYAAIKRGLNQAKLGGLAEQLALETEMQVELAVSDDHAEGVAAFGDRRDPVFRGFK